MGIVECACTPRKAPASAQCARCRSRHSTRLTKRRTRELRSPRASSVDPLGDLRRSATTGTPCAAAGHGPKGGIWPSFFHFPHSKNSRPAPPTDDDAGRTRDD